MPKNITPGQIAYETWGYYFDSLQTPSCAEPWENLWPLEKVRWEGVAAAVAQRKVLQAAEHEVEAYAKFVDEVRRIS